MKALILAGGRGKRLEGISEEKNKCMIEIHGKPVLEYNLEYVSQTEVEEIILIVGYRAEEIINRFGISFSGKPIKYVIQWEQKGLVHAIECARESLGKADFALFLGDEIFLNPRHNEMYRAFNTGKYFGMCGILSVKNRERIKKTYTIIQNNEGVIHRLVEKPRNPINDLMGTGSCVFRNEILKYIEFTPIHQERKEKEFPDLVQCAVDEGKVIKSFVICDQYVNINSMEDYKLAEGFFK